MSAEIDPEAYADTEVIKQKLEAILQGQERIEGRLEAFQATLDEVLQKEGVR